MLLSPATVDFDHWLNESVDRSPLAAQIEVMDRIARRLQKPQQFTAIFGFDPLQRSISESMSAESSEPDCARSHRSCGSWVSGSEALSADGIPCVSQHRSLFQIHHKAHRQSEYALGCHFDRTVFAVRGTRCAGSSLMRTGSNGAAKHFERRADPAFWIPVFETHPKLRPSVVRSLSADLTFHPRDLLAQAFLRRAGSGQ